MIFMIKSQANVQLGAVDFHNQYRDAIRIQLRRDLTSYVSLRYGHVLDLWVADEFINANPKLQSHDGTAIFRVQFVAFVDQVVQNEVAMGYLEEIIQEEEQYHLIFRVGSRRMHSYLRAGLYQPELEGDVQHLHISDELANAYASRGIALPPLTVTQLSIRQFYRIRILDNLNSCLLIGIPPFIDDASDYNSDESGAGNMDENDVSNRDESIDF